LLPLVFDCFQQGDSARQQRHGGFGLGLFIAKSLAEAQQGTLTAASEGRGKGATFLLTLKLAPPGEPPSEPQEASARDRLRILLTEDHADTRAVIVKLLEHRGHTVFAAEDTASALRLAATCDFELLISDIGLPDGTGHALMQRLRLRRPALMGIALSGYGMPSDIQKSREAGFSHHLVKPITLDSLQAAIQTVVADRREGAAASNGSQVV
jgi:CheY-like chemotaxis protein